MTKCEDIPYIIDYTPLSQLQGYSPIILQLPDGLRQYTQCISKRIAEETGAKIIIDADPSYGACDLHYPRIKTILGAKAIVHVAHTPYPRELSWRGLEPEGRPRIIYLYAKSIWKPSQESLTEAIELLKQENASKIGIVSTSQHTHLLEEVAQELENHGLTPIIPHGHPPYFESGQVIGCDYRLARKINPDAYLIIASGTFHPLGLYLSTLKPIIQLDPYASKATDRTREFEKFYSTRLYKVSIAMNADHWGIIIGLKTGQYRPWLIRELEALLSREKKKYTLYAAESINEERIRTIDSPHIDAWIITSCPRIPLDDLHKYEKPVLTPGEAKMALTRRLEPYLFPW